MDQLDPNSAPTGPELGGRTAGTVLRFVGGFLLGVFAGGAVSFAGGLLTLGLTGYPRNPHSPLHLLGLTGPAVLLVLALFALRRLARGATEPVERGFMAGAAVALLVGTLCAGSMSSSMFH